jgi:hypothetical protein
MAWYHAHGNSRNGKVDGHPYTIFHEQYLEFVADVLLPRLGGSCLAVQQSPTFRCHLPRTGSTGKPHRDEDYGHPVSELNFWVPLTAVYGSNSLWCESARGVGDFSAFEAIVGDCVQFYGNQCWHRVLPNETEGTRVSIDFRVVREAEFSPATFRRFELGGFYTLVRAQQRLHV